MVDQYADMDYEYLPLHIRRTNDLIVRVNEFKAAVGFNNRFRMTDLFHWGRRNIPESALSRHFWVSSSYYQPLYQKVRTTTARLQNECSMFALPRGGYSMTTYYIFRYIDLPKVLKRTEDPDFRMLLGDLLDDPTLSGKILKRLNYIISNPN